MKQNEPLLRVENLSFGYARSASVLNHVSLCLKPGEIYTVLGSNGAGKSTLLACLERHLKPREGEIYVDGQNIADMNTAVLAKKIGVVAQTQSLAFDFTVRNYLVLGRAPHISLLQMPGKQEYEIVDRIMDQMQMTNLADKSILQISGGERQQAQIARVLVQDPKLILMDEPTNHLDYGNQIKVLKMIVDLALNKGIAIILTTHNPDHAILLGGKSGILDYDGKLITGDTSEIITQANLRRIYQADLRMAYVPEVQRMTCVACNIR
jgi:iron complex transport system ATP-binding protein